MRHPRKQGRPARRRPLAGGRLRTPALALFLVLLAGCAAVPRGPALQLAEAGQKATSASQRALQGIADDADQITLRQLVRTSLINCRRQPVGAAPASPCTPAVLTPEAAEADAANQKLAAVILLRVRAISALGAAYQALADEANYDARGELEAAIGGLNTQVNALTGSLQALGAPSLSLLAVEPLVQQGAGVLAERAQIRRLKAASRQIGQADAALAAAIQAESALYGRIAGPLGMNKARVVDQLFQSGLADPAGAVASFDAPLGLAAPKTGMDDRAALVLARTMVAYRAQRDAAAVDELYRLNVAALQALVGQHRKFEADRPLSLEDLAQAIDQLAGWTQTIKAAEGPSGADQPGARH